MPLPKRLRQSDLPTTSKLQIFTRKTLAFTLLKGMKAKVNLIPYNPDPAATVKYGPQTYHEMMFGFVFYTDDDEQLNLDIDPETGYVIAAPEAGEHAAR